MTSTCGANIAFCGWTPAKPRLYGSAPSQTSLSLTEGTAQSLFVHYPTGRGRPRSRPPSGHWTFYEAACEQGGSHLLLSSTPPSPDPQTSRQWSNYPACPCVDYVPHWLLQLSIGRPATVDDRTTAASAERSSSTGVRIWTKGVCYYKPSPAPLATSPQASPVKICCLIHPIHHGNPPEYLKNIARSVDAMQPISSCSPVSTFNWLRVAALRTKFVERGTHCVETSVHIRLGSF